MPEYLWLWVLTIVYFCFAVLMIHLKFRRLDESVCCVANKRNGDAEVKSLPATDAESESEPVL